MVSTSCANLKKKDGSYHFCIDYRKFNSNTNNDAYPLPRIGESLDQQNGSSWISTLDLCSEYWQIEMDQEDKPKTAFASRRGLFQFNVMPFGLCCVPATFERLMESVLAGLHWDTCLVYLDDINVAGKTFEEMLSNIRNVFDRLKGAGIKLKATKCCPFAKKVTYLGHVVSAEGVHV